MRILVLGAFVALAPTVTGCGGEVPGSPSRESHADDANISYDSKTNLAFTNNRILLFSTPNANPSEVVQSLAKYGTVDASNSSSGMYAVTTDEHFNSAQLSELIDRIVGSEELIAGDPSIGHCLARVTPLPRCRQRHRLGHSITVHLMGGSCRIWII